MYVSLHALSSFFSSFTNLFWSDGSIAIIKCCWCFHTHFDFFSTTFQSADQNIFACGWSFWMMVSCDFQEFHICPFIHAQFPNTDLTDRIHWPKPATGSHMNALRRISDSIDELQPAHREVRPRNLYKAPDMNTKKLWILQRVFFFRLKQKLRSGVVQLPLFIKSWTA